MHRFAPRAILDLMPARRAIGDDDGIHMQFRPNLQVAEMIWSDEQAGRDSSRALYSEATSSNSATGRIVRTAAAN